MKTIVSVLLMLVLAEAVLFLRARRENQSLLLVSSQVEALRSELAQAGEGAAQHETDLQAVREEVGRLQDELNRSKAALKEAASGEATAPERAREVLPVGLTTNDVDLAGMRVTGTNTIGLLSIPLVGKSLEQLREMHYKRRPLVFGLQISDGYYGLWSQRDTTNLLGFGLRFGSAAEAEAVAVRMRELVEGIDGTK